MTGSHRALLAVALVAALAMPAALVEAQGGPRVAAQGGYGRGYGPGMMGGGYGYGPQMMGDYGPGMGWGYGGGRGYGPGMMWGWNGIGGANDATTAVNFASGRLAFLKAELKITPQQQALWDKYAATVRDSTKTLYEQHQLFLTHLQTDEGLPQRLDEREEVMATAFAEMRKADAALKPLYAVLDAGQKKIADDLLGRPAMGYGMF